MKEYFYFLLKRHPYSGEGNRPENVSVCYETYEGVEARLKYLDRDPKEYGYYHTALCISGETGVTIEKLG